MNSLLDGPSNLDIVIVGIVNGDKLIREFSSCVWSQFQLLPGETDSLCLFNRSRRAMLDTIVNAVRWLAGQREAGFESDFACARVGDGLQ